MARALAYNLTHGTAGLPVTIPTKGGSQCGHYTRCPACSGRSGYRLVRDPNAICGLTTKSVSGAVQACTANPSLCANVPLPAGWSQVGTTGITGRTPSEVYGNIAIR